MSGGQSLGQVQEGRREKLRGVRRLVAEHMVRAHREVPPVTWVEECDFSDIDLKRIVPVTLKAVAESLREFPELNARIDGDEIVYLDRYDIGVAVQTEQGLVVPVVRGCDQAPVDEQPELADRFRVTTVPTLALVKDKRVVDRLEGRVSAPRIERMLEPHLDSGLVAA